MAWGLPRPLAAIIMQVMDDNHSARAWKYRPRWIEDLLAEAVRAHPVVVLTGARQVGKSTLLRHAPAVAGWPHRSLDDLDVLAQAERDPEALWAGARAVILDEAQRAPQVFLAVKRAVDRDRGRRFVLSGSANFLLLRQVSESLAGRAVHFVLRPMTLGELEGKRFPPLLSALFEGNLPPEKRVGDAPNPVSIVLNGFMPSLAWLPSPTEAVQWWEGYVATYLERDLRDLSQIASLSDFRQVMGLTALRTGQLVNQTEVARDAGVSQPTVHRYLSLLETSFLLHRLPAFAKSKSKRLIKSPKIYWADPALAAFLMGHYTEEAVRGAREEGALFENVVLLHLLVLAEILRPKARVYYWRTVSGAEVDFVVEWGRKLVAFEVKPGERARYSDVKTLQTFLSEYPECQAGVLVYGGGEVVRLGERIVAVPWQLLTGE
ncbi:MAG: ATP-binding protein [Candidatus Bipolaricaulota bacterium]